MTVEGNTMDPAERILAGDVRATARLLRDIDDKIPSAKEILKKLYPHTGKAYVVGFTGSPGVGKSTLVDQLTIRYREEGKTVGILVIDPSSPFSGGAILGDRIRMQRHFLDPGVFIRSLATRGHLGGITNSTNDMIAVLDAMGKDIIFVETVGVGQDEVEIASCAHTTVVVTIPGMGDEIQAIKAGLMEIGDILVVNKADREGSRKIVQELRGLISLEHLRAKQNQWEPIIVTTEAVKGRGIDELYDAIQKHRDYLMANDRKAWKEVNFKQAYMHLIEVLREELIEEITCELEEKGLSLEKMAEKIASRQSDPYSLVKEILEKVRYPVAGN